MVEHFQNRLRLLQQNVRDNLNCQAFLVPRVDRYQGEYVVEADERLAWLTGFTGSAGIAVVTPDEVTLFVDGRYTLQARQQVPSDVNVIHTEETSLFTYLESKLPPAAIIAYDPWLHTVREQQRWREKENRFSWVFHAVEENPIDQIWLDRPVRPLDPIFLLDEQYTGKGYLEKINTAVATLKQTGASLAYIGSPDAICWLLNIRGADFPYTPLVDAMAFLDNVGVVTLVINPAKIPQHISKAWAQNVRILAEDQLFSFLKDRQDQKILIHAASTPIQISQLFLPGQVIFGDDLCLLPKACKNAVEQAGMRQAHLKDGLAVSRFLCWLSQNTDPLTELDVVDKLELFRQQEDTYQGPSFPTIAGYASNGAIVHYRPDVKSNKLLQDGSLLLLDSGGQYLEGTTDITRTIAIGAPTEEQRNYFTRVLKGHIALAKSQFPKGTCGRQLDILARQPLWEIGDDYDHGTGHGVGCFLNVHEGPQRISKFGSDTALQLGMVLSNEPGYYKTDAYGIRIENLVLVCESKLETDRLFYCFETLTLVPFDLSLIMTEWLVGAERDWINDYHQTIRDQLLPFLEPETAAWLMEVTEPI
jgi:Xaa-Pro aminopeptidase